MYPTTVTNASCITKIWGTATGMMLFFGGLVGAIPSYLIGIMSKKVISI